MPNSKLFTFGGRANALQDIKWLTDDQFKSRVFNFNHDVSPGDNPSEAFGVNRYLPLKNEVYQGEGSYGKKRGLVINHGSIVSADNIFPDSYYDTADANVGIGVSGEVVRGADVLGNPIVSTNDNGFRGYGKGVRSLLTIANGGVQVTDLHSTLDVAHGRYNGAGALIADGDTHVRPANIPVGIAHNTVWRDDVGEVLNYSTKVILLDSIQSDHFIKVPCVLVDRAAAIVTAGSLPANAAALTPGAAEGFDFDGSYGAVYAALAKWTSFAYMDEASLIYGSFVQSDQNGNYIPQRASGVNSGVAPALMAKTAQTVGKMFSLDAKWPKDNTEMNLSFTDTKVTGSDTLGIPADLFIFGWEYLKASGVTATADILAGIEALINGAAIGHLRVNLHVS